MGVMDDKRRQNSRVHTLTEKKKDKLLCHPERCTQATTIHLETTKGKNTAIGVGSLDALLAIRPPTTLEDKLHLQS
jgi:hypothetical protein